MSGAIYCMDANPLIHAWRDTHRPASFPSFWKNLEALISEGRMVAPIDVKDELKSPPDLVAWASRNKAMFQELDEATQLAYRDIMADLVAWLKTLNDLKLVAKDLKADPAVAAMARAHKLVVVTHEAPRRGLPARPKLPDVCQRHGVESVRLADMIQREGWRY